MERGNSKHGAVLDDQMASEVRGIFRGPAGGRADESHTPEPAGEDQPEVTIAPNGDFGRGVPNGVGSAQGEALSRFGSFLGRNAFPGDRAALEASARAMSAPDDVLRRIGTLPEGQTFQNTAEAWHASEGGDA
ncbi:hypothetical protein ACWT_6454 [Actinoplanes sp. SE50]|uniref:DUF2795 domain-containing protein n=1 Tax=unclassified Actinoplanes TaxID=2626549 RepID=UPI00023EBFB7|nr:MULTISPECIES: DUF2795 domain-containing protein [unclassified Actinoplanes]AEV87467.1 hypothetical protein ACPL_6585 [Actinoplanes sp. SE50/110]ATO85869.1 hypothetical protein ACWT_6454 [Actinoplanes sp. SE50]SLM03283.1 hypothetical protein ACSP50_6572 [Actinoplanes sp. SE50/110]